MMSESNGNVTGCMGMGHDWVIDTSERDLEAHHMSH